MTEKPLVPVYVNTLKFDMTGTGEARLLFSDVFQGQDDRVGASIVCTVASAEAFAAMILRVIAEVRAKAESENATKQ